MISIFTYCWEMIYGMLEFLVYFCCFLIIYIHIRMLDLFHFGATAALDLGLHLLVLLLLLSTNSTPSIR